MRLSVLPDGRDVNWVHRNLDIQAQAMTPEQVDEAMAQLDIAIAQVDETENPLLFERLAVQRDALVYSEFLIKEYNLALELRDMTVTSTADAEAVMQKIEELGRMSVQRERFWDDALTRGDLLGDFLDYASRINALSSEEIGGFEAEALLAAIRVNDFQTGLVEPRLTQPTLGAVARMIEKWFNHSSVDNLMVNGDFESSTGSLTAPWYEKDGDFTITVESGTGRPDDNDQPTNGLRISGVGDGESAWVKQHINPVGDVLAGDQFLAVAWIKAESSSGASGVADQANLHARFQYEDGKLDARIVTMSGVEEDGWQMVAIHVTVPTHFQKSTYTPLDLEDDGLRIQLASPAQKTQPT